ncbi:MAG: hypothetical protein S4CHLAM123_05340 [Chlamydiales bacterium]|nr:hypothetical protein [Chlamydiales bacterium]
MIKKSFTLRILAISFLVLALPLLIDSFIFFKSSYVASIDAAKAALKEVARYRTLGLTQAQPIKQAFLNELEYIYDLGAPTEGLNFEQITQQFSEIAKEGEGFQIFFLTLPTEGHFQILASSIPSVVGSSFISYLRLAEVLENGRGSFIRYNYSVAKQRYVPHIFLARTIRSQKTGKNKGILMVTVDIEQVLKSVLEDGKQMKNVDIAILNADSIVFASTNPDLEGQYFDPISLKRRYQVEDSGQLGFKTLPKSPLPVIEEHDAPYFEFIFDQQVQIAYRAYMPDTGISVLAFAPKELVFGKAVRHFLLIYSIYGLILIVGGGITYWLSLFISRPLRQLSYLMGQVSEGNLDVQFHKEPLGFEINILGTSFNRTLRDLLDNIQKAEDERVRKETYQRELAIGRQVQYSLLPTQDLQIEGAQIAGTYMAAEDVGGDFYEYFAHTSKKGEESFVCVVADAAGRGIFSCLYALAAKSLFRTYGSLYDTIGEILSLSNNAFTSDTGDTGMYLTAVMVMYHPKTKILEYHSCGHVPGIVRRKNGELLTLEHSGMAIGLKESQTYSTESIQLYSGDVVLLYTDGLLEAFNEKYQHFTPRRLRHLLQTHDWMSAQDVVDGISADLKSFIDDIVQLEEIIIVAMKVE